jgi:hypothetical protein
VKQITSQQNKVDFGLFGNLEYLFECVDGVLTANGVLLGVADVVVGS